MNSNLSTREASLPDPEKQIIIVASTFAQSPAAGERKDSPKNGPWTSEQKPADMTFRCYAGGTTISETQQRLTVRFPNPPCHKDQPGLIDLSWQNRDRMKNWRDDILEHFDGKGEPVQFNTAYVARSLLF